MVGFETVDRIIKESFGKSRNNKDGNKSITTHSSSRRTSSAERSSSGGQSARIADSDSFISLKNDVKGFVYNLDNCVVGFWL